MALLATLPAAAERIRLGTFNAELARDGPGLLLQDLEGGEDPQIAAVVAVVAAVDPDVLVLQSIDWDHGLVTLSALADAFGRAGSDYPYRLALRPNSGMATGRDLDGDGRLGGAGDAQGHGSFSGTDGMAILSRLPIAEAEVRDLSAMLWRDLPGNLIEADTLSPGAGDVQRLSTTGHWIVPLVTPSGGRLTLMTWHATPPVFDGAEDRNGRRNHDEAALWLRVLDGALGPSPVPPFVVIGNANLDPAAIDGRPEALRTLLARPDLNDPAPTSEGAAFAEGNSEGPGVPDPQDTVDWSDGERRAGNLRVSYVLPSTDLAILDSGVFWPAPDDPLAATVAQASRHRMVWTDIDLP